jgi:hypothetical protein
MMRTPSPSSFETASAVLPLTLGTRDRFDAPLTDSLSCRIEDILRIALPGFSEVPAHRLVKSFRFGHVV